MTKLESIEMKKAISTLLLGSILSLTATIAHAESLPIKIKQGMSYEKARQILIDAGWQTVVMNRTPNGTPLCYGADWGQDCDGLYEIESCAGTGMGYCNMWFYDGGDVYLWVRTVGDAPPDASVDAWWKKTSEDISERITIHEQE